MVCQEITHTPTNEQQLNKATSKEYILLTHRFVTQIHSIGRQAKKAFSRITKKKKREDEESNNYLKKNSFPYFSVIKRTYKSKQNSMQFLV